MTRSFGPRSCSCQLRGRAARYDQVTRVLVLMGLSRVMQTGWRVTFPFRRWWEFLNLVVYSLYVLWCNRIFQISICRYLFPDPLALLLPEEPKATQCIAPLRFKGAGAALGRCLPGPLSYVMGAPSLRLNARQLPSSSGFAFFSTHVHLDLKLAQSVDLALALSLLSWLWLWTPPLTRLSCHGPIGMAALCPPRSSFRVTTSGLGCTVVWPH